MLVFSAVSAQFDYSYKPNNAGGLHLGGSYTKQFGTPDHNIGGTVFGSGNLNPGNSIRLKDKNYGGSVDYNK